MVKMIVRTSVAILLCIMFCIQLMPHDCQALCVGANACTCEAKSYGVIINCRDQNLDRVPTFQNDDPDRLFEELTLQKNHIGRIDEKAFTTLRLKRLLLSENPIVNISAIAFQGLESDLKELILELASQADFPAAAVQSLKQLNQLEVIGYRQQHLPNGALASLTNVEAIGFTMGGLQELSAADFTDQCNTLLYLDLNSNQFTEIPVAAINSLTRLSELNLKLNGITAIRESSFSSLVQLKVLDISRNSLTSVHSNAFSGLEGCLQNLTMQYCHLTSESIQSVRLLRTLILLDISDNQITSIDSLLGNMKSLQELKIARNRITYVARTVYRSLSSSLRLLDLSFNQITEVTPDAFLDLNQLQELYLDGAAGLQLDRNSFSAQQTSLKLLSLRFANLSASQWTSVNNLTGLQTLWMSNCALNNIPDFTFQMINQLENLDLNENEIGRITQRSLTGLQNSLVRLYLSKNQLTTLDECVFHQFTKIDILRLQLNSNPLECDCSMKWLHDRLEQLRKNVSSIALINSLRWTCANGRLFNSLTDADFASCMPTTMGCEDLGGQTTTPTIGTIALNVVNISSTSMTVLWTISLKNTAITILSLQYGVKGKDSKSAISLGPELRNATLTGLTPATTYVITLQADTVDGTISASTSASTTSEKSESSNLPVILGCTLGLGLALVLLVIAIVIVLALRKKRQKDGKEVIKPKLGDQTKRFIKPDVSRANSLGQQATHSPSLTPAAATEMDSDDLIVHTLETMSDEEKYRLVNLLTNSRGSMDGLNTRGSMDRLNDIGLPVHVQPYQITEPSKERHVYEEIPDSYYDEIQTDDTV